jgi:hypothetical protein
MSPRLATTASPTSTRTTSPATWVWRDASTEGVLPSAMVQSGPPPRGCF